MRMYASVLLLTILGVAAGSPIAVEDLRLLDFRLEDQFDTVHASSDVAGRIVLLIGSDKDGSEFNGAWSRAIHDALGDHPQYDRIAHLAHADLRGVPFFLKGFVRGKFPQDPDRWVLMDWKGVLAETYGFAPECSNVLVFDKDGALMHHASGREPGDEAIRSLVSVLRELLDQAD